MYNKQIKFILEKYKINEIWNFSEPYYSAYIDKICGDYLHENTAGHQNSIFHNLSCFTLHTIMILGGALWSIIKTYKYRNKNYSVEKRDVNIIAFPFCHHYIRFKQLPQIIKTPFRIVAHPQFHSNHLGKHVEYFKSKKLNLEVFTFRVRDIANSLFLLLKYHRSLKKCSKELDSVFGVYKGKFSKTFIFVPLYKGFLEKFISNQIKSFNSHIWIFDYDFDYKYIIFNDVIHKLRPLDKTVHLMHGTFVSATDVYVNPCSDYTLCSSEREKVIIEKYNKYSSIIIPLGAPLQSFNDDEIKKESSKCFDILLLLTNAYIKEFEELQKGILKQLPIEHYRIKARFRPASRNLDEPILLKYLSGVIISEGNSLLEDVLSAKLIISFSEDAIYECIRNNRPIVYCKEVNYKQIYSYQYESSYLKITNVTDFSKLDLAELIKKSDSCDYTGDKFVFYNFGCFLLNDLKFRMTNILKEICQ